MSITDELRSWAEGNTLRAGMSLRTARDQALAIADRIDAEHERQLEVLYRDMSDAEYVKLPKDAYGEPIHVGDVMDFSKNVRGLTVLGIGIADANESSYGVFVREGNEYVWYNAKFLHHHVPTVEDVLRGVVTLCHNTWKEGSAFEFYDVDDVMKSGNIADFAAKLRLAGDAE